VLLEHYSGSLFLYLVIESDQIFLLAAPNTFLSIIIDIIIIVIIIIIIINTSVLLGRKVNKS